MTPTATKNTQPDKTLNTVSKSTSEKNTSTYPTSPAQQRLWFLDQLNPGNPSYNMSQAFRLKGHVDHSVLSKSINTIIQRHGSLRTTFSVKNYIPVQIIHRNLVIECPVINATDTDIQKLINDEFQKPFDLKTGPLVRSVLFRLAKDDYIFIIVIHHINFDRRSDGLFNQELSILYNNAANNDSLALSELPIQYTDYSIWKQEKIQGEALQKQLSYWMEHLSGITPLELPTDHPRSVSLNTKGERKYLDLPAELINNFEKVSSQNGATLFMGLLAAFQTLLHLWTGSDDIVIGTPFADRRLNGTKQLLGFFVNTLILRTDLSEDPTFDELLNRTRKVCFNAYRYNGLPFEKLVEELRPERNINRNPIFDIEFALQKAHTEKLSLNGLTSSPLTAEKETSQYDLTLTVREKTECYDARIEYRTDLFDSESIEKLLHRFKLLLERITIDPKQNISKLPFLSSAEKHLMLVDWNDTAVDYTRDQCLHNFFEEQASKTPDATAIKFESQQITYEELNKKANQLAHFLRSKNVTKEIMIGVFTERSVEMIIALYGILKAGGGYVPLDPTLPQGRLSYMLNDTLAPIILSQKHLAELIPESDAEVIYLDHDWPTISDFNSDNPKSITTPENLAYVIYTSGSTGNPKGVINCHSGIVNRLLWMQDEYQLNKSNTVLQKTPYSFDVSVWEFFWPLMFGARLVIAKPEGPQDPVYLAELIKNEAITTLHFVPSMLRAFVDIVDTKNCASIQKVFCSGEALPYDLQQDFFQFSNAELHNLYGPTEAAVDVTYWKCNSDYERSIVPIGRPIANTQIYILDADLRPVPIGASGELHIGGIQLARGYLNLKDLTKEKFIANPFSKDPNARLYKSGDLARYLRDGQIEYLGRIDFQVKIRGLRIELGEIELALTDLDYISQAVVTVHEERAGDPRLVAYYVPTESTYVDSTDLRKRLTDSIPKYMMPQFFIELESFPLSPNGKIDRKCLPAPDTNSTAINHDYIAPRSDSEKQMAAIWEDTLGLERVGIHDNFIEIGGHSLLALQIISKVKREMNIVITPVSILMNTLEQIIAEIEGEYITETSLTNTQNKTDKVIPIYFGDKDKQLLGLYHPPISEVIQESAILLCNPVYMEGINSHWVFRRLANKLSSIGFHVLRFDYYGTGDSAGGDIDVSINQWIDDIKTASTKIMGLSHIDKISIVGLRFGATLAALTNDLDIKDLILWDPVVNGQKYIDDLKSKHKSSVKEFDKLRKKTVTPNPDEILGYCLPSNMQHSIEEIDLLDIFNCSAEKIFLLSSSEKTEYKQLQNKLNEDKDLIFKIVNDSDGQIEIYDELSVFLPGNILRAITAALTGRFS